MSDVSGFPRAVLAFRAFQNIEASRRILEEDSSGHLQADPKARFQFKTVERISDANTGLGCACFGM